eukprot:s520_g27.t1
MPHVNHEVPAYEYLTQNDMFPAYDQFAVNAQVFEYGTATQNAQVSADEPMTVSNVVMPTTSSAKTIEPNAIIDQLPVTPTGHCDSGLNNVTEYDIENGDSNSFTYSPCFHPAREVLMVLKDTQLCPHSSYLGGDEREYHRGANGHTRHLTCKNSECDKTVIVGRRRDASQMWRYLVQIALCTKWGSAARSHELFASVCREREHALLSEEHRAALKPPAGYPHRGPTTSSPASSPASPTSQWDVVPSEQSSGSQQTAKIIRNRDPRFWAYGVLVAPAVNLPEFPTLADEDLDILQPLPCDSSLCGGDSPYAEYSLAQIASSPESAAFCHQTLQLALQNQPLTPELYHLPFYLYNSYNSSSDSTLEGWN